MLALGGAEVKDIVGMLLFVTSFERGQEFDEIYGHFFWKNFPVRTRVQVAALAPGCHVEIEAIAVAQE